MRCRMDETNDTAALEEEKDEKPHESLHIKLNGQRIIASESVLMIEKTPFDFPGSDGTLIQSVIDPKDGNNEKQDRISSLPDYLISHILSLLDAKFAVQTTVLSTRWNNLWKKSLSVININSCFFRFRLNFGRFVTQFLCARDNHSVFKFNCRIEICPYIGKLLDEIAVYGALHNLKCLNITSQVKAIPPSVFTIQSLEELSIKSVILASNVPSKSPWNLAALTTLFLSRVSFNSGGAKSLDLFSNLLNLKNLSLIDCDTKDLEFFCISPPQLENLRISINSYRNNSCEFVVLSSNLSSFDYKGNQILHLSAKNLNCLYKVHIDVSIYNLFWNDDTKVMVCQEIINLFHQLSDAKFVTLSLHTIGVLSLVFELLRNQPSPFCKMECLEIERNCWQSNSTFPSALLTYLCNSSSSCNVINEYKRLKLVAANYYFPKKNELKPLGEDALFICNDNQTIGVADGVGGWAKKGVDAGEYARELMSNTYFSIVSNYQEGENVDPKLVLSEAFLNTKSNGSSTACIVALNNGAPHNYLHAANIGDSGFVVVRDEKIVYKSPIQQERFNCPYQLQNNTKYFPDSVIELVFPVVVGDIIVVGTDGLFDNAYDYEIEGVVNLAMKHPEMPHRPELLACIIAHYCLQRAEDNTYFSPFARASKEAGFQHVGGKYDDITVVVAYVRPADESDSYYAVEGCYLTGRKIFSQETAWNFLLSFGDSSEDYEWAKKMIVLLGYPSESGQSESKKPRVRRQKSCSSKGGHLDSNSPSSISSKKGHSSASNASSSSSSSSSEREYSSASRATSSSSSSSFSGRGNSSGSNNFSSREEELKKSFKRQQEEARKYARRIKFRHNPNAKKLSEFISRWLQERPKWPPHIPPPPKWPSHIPPPP